MDREVGPTRQISRGNWPMSSNLRRSNSEFSSGSDLGQAVIEKFNCDIGRARISRRNSYRKSSIIRTPYAKVFTHKWLDPQCVSENGCQSIALWAKHNSAVSGGRAGLTGWRP